MFGFTSPSQVSVSSLPLGRQVGRESVPSNMRSLPPRPVATSSRESGLPVTNPLSTSSELCQKEAFNIASSVGSLSDLQENCLSDFRRNLFSVLPGTQLGCSGTELPNLLPSVDFFQPFLTDFTGDGSLPTHGSVNSMFGGDGSFLQSLPVSQLPILPVQTGMPFGNFNSSSKKSESTKSEASPAARRRIPKRKSNGKTLDDMEDFNSETDSELETSTPKVKRPKSNRSDRSCICCYTAKTGCDSTKNLEIFRNMLPDDVISKLERDADGNIKDIDVDTYNPFNAAFVRTIKMCATN